MKDRITVAAVVVGGSYGVYWITTNVITGWALIIKDLFR